MQIGQEPCPERRIYIADERIWEVVHEMGRIVVRGVDGDSRFGTK